jgi:hypothetical protein
MVVNIESIETVTATFGPKLEELILVLLGSTIKMSF